MDNKSALLPSTADIVSSFVSNNSVPLETLPDLIRSVNGALSEIAMGQPSSLAAAERQKPAVPISKSVQPDYIVCLEDGAKLKMLKRYLNAHFNLSPAEYRAKWKLPADYPMVAPSYSAKRADFAKSIGLGKGVRVAPTLEKSRPKRPAPKAI